MYDYVYIIYAFVKYLDEPPVIICFWVAALGRIPNLWAKTFSVENPIQDSYELPNWCWIVAISSALNWKHLHDMSAEDLHQECLNRIRKST